MFSKKIGVGVIGTGMAAKPHALALNDLKEIIDVKAIFSRNRDKCHSFANIIILKWQIQFKKFLKIKVLIWSF